MSSFWTPGGEHPVGPPSAGDADGRGVWLVDRDATAWGVEARDRGKAVWFELRGAAAAIPCAAGA